MKRGRKPSVAKPLNGAEKDYKFGQKNNWRRRVWNEISRRVPDRRNAIVLYLAGEQDLDRVVALQHGFQPDNLLIVERDPAVAAKLRAEGKIVIESDFINAMAAWNPERRVAVIMGDFCSGFRAEYALIYQSAIFNPAFQQSVFALNMIRGRDHETNNIREWISEAWEDADFALHRGKQYIWIMSLYLFNSIVHGKSGADAFDLLAVKRNPEIMNRALDWHDAVFYSYQSGGRLIFDSVIFDGPGKGFKLDDPKIYAGFKKWNPPSIVKQTRRRIAAALAIRTMKGRAA